MLTPALAYNLLPTGWGIEPPDRHRPVLSQWLGLHRLGPPFEGGGSRLLGRVIRLGCWPSRSLVDHTFYGEPYPYQATLSDVRVIMVIMHVLMVELLCQAVTGQIPALECLLAGVRGCLLLL
jgi:hypothetical protein